MRTKLAIAIILITTACFVLPSSASEPPDLNDPNRYLNAVRTFAESR
ncbi:MAG: hypothetical protein ACYS74_03690 [Planctomycetota bacterium]|jgi:hypothetical protein